jgi:hypothetical protein
VNARARAADAALLTACVVALAFWASRIAESWGMRYAASGHTTPAPIAALAEIETAGTEALDALRQAVGILRVGDHLDTSPAARTVTVDVTPAPGTLTVEITDDSPARPRNHPRHGLLGMRERVEALGGHLQAGPREDRPGWSVTATLPVRTPR